MTSGGLAFGQSVNNVSSDQVIYACVTGVNGNIIKVSNSPKTCPRGTSPISWNMLGPKGDAGPQGVSGEKGQKGDQGPMGSGGVSWYLQNLTTNETIQVLTVPSIGGGSINAVEIDGSYWRIGHGGLYEFQELEAGYRTYFDQIGCQGNSFMQKKDLRFSDIQGSTLRAYNGPYFRVDFSTSSLATLKSFSYRADLDSSTECFNITNFGNLVEFLKDVEGRNVPNQISADAALLQAVYWSDSGIDLTTCNWNVEFFLDYEFTQTVNKNYIQGSVCPATDINTRKLYPSGSPLEVLGFHLLRTTEIDPPQISFEGDWVMKQN